MVTANTDRVLSLYASKDDEKPYVYKGVTLEQGSTIVETDGDKIWMLSYNNSTEQLEWKEYA